MRTKPLIIFSCYHKSGTTLLRHFIADYAEKHDLTWREGHCERFSATDFQEMDIWFDPWGTALVPHDLSKENRNVEEATGRNCIGVHLIRDPRNIIVSGYLYHKSQEKEAAWKGYYKETLNSLDQDNGLLFEMSRTARETITRMQKWDYSNDIFLELRYENLMQNFTGTFQRILRHIGSPTPAEDLVLAERHDINRMSKEELEQNTHIISKKFDPYKWTSFLKGVHLAKLNSLFGDLGRLNYSALGDAC